MPLDIGPVLLNLYISAFYVMDRRARAGITGYLRQIAVRTRRLGQVQSIEVQGNGKGVPEKFRKRIFQRFFTTRSPDR
jgi:signal transduction histidine kinase